MAFPFSAIVGQEEMKLAILIAAVEPAIGGMLVFGDRGTGKSTAVRSLAALLPIIIAVAVTVIRYLPSLKDLNAIVTKTKSLPSMKV
ncbi:MAG: ATP-binding protein, partial [Aquincola sp.]|nr:ATP-binding protein [Aquincola sp.]